MREAELITALQDAFWQVAEDVMLHHTNPWELDEALEAYGYETGPCIAQDHIGLVNVLSRQPRRLCPVLPRMVAEGRHGKVSGVGYYRYPGGGGAVIDPLIEDLIREEAWFAKVARVELDDVALVAKMNVGLAAACRGLPVSQGVPELLARAVQFPINRFAELDV